MLNNKFRLPAKRLAPPLAADRKDAKDAVAMPAPPPSSKKGKAAAKTAVGRR